MSILEYIKLLKPTTLLVWISLAFSIIQLFTAASVVKVWPTQDVKLIVCDVGQGDAIFLKNRFSYALVDAGTDSNQAVLCLSKHVPWFDSRLDLFVATHPDSDHIGGAEGVLNRFEISQLMLTTDTKDTAVFEGFRNAVLSKKMSGTQLLFPNQQMKGKLGNSIEYRVLAPQDRVSSANVFIHDLPETTLSDVIAEHGESIENYNERSIVLFLKIHGTTILLPGDIESKTETAITKTNLLTQVDILKVAHHGSKTSSTIDFISKVVPEVALISVGHKNRFGHPSSDVISRLESVGSRVLRTDEQGEIVVHLSTDKYKVSTQR